MTGIRSQGLSLVAFRSAKKHSFAERKATNDQADECVRSQSFPMYRV